MQRDIFYLSADYEKDGMDLTGQYVIMAPSERMAVEWLLGKLEKWADVHAIVSVYGVDNIQELKEVSRNGFFSGMAGVAYVY